MQSITDRKGEIINIMLLRIKTLQEAKVAALNLTTTPLTTNIIRTLRICEIKLAYDGVFELRNNFPYP